MLCIKKVKSNLYPSVIALQNLYSGLYTLYLILMLQLLKTIYLDYFIGLDNEYHSLSKDKELL